jgi:hypothetical protein
MKRIPIAIEILSCLSVAVLGAYLTDKGISETNPILADLGALFFAAAAMALIFAARSLFWHWSMLRDGNRSTDD